MCFINRGDVDIFHGQRSHKANSCSARTVASEASVARQVGWRDLIGDQDISFDKDLLNRFKGS